MVRKKQFQKQLSAILVSFLLVIQTLSPFAVVNPIFAQETTPTQTEEQTVTPAPEITTTPEQDSTPTTTPEITPDVTPAEEVTPTMTPTETQTPADTPEPTAASPPTENGSTTTSIDPTPTIEPAPTITVTPQLQSQEVNGQLAAVILENTDAPSVDLEPYADPGSATLVTDKPDYAPTDTAIITGTGFTPNHTYSLTISSTDQPPTSTTVTVTSDETGTFAYAYQLDGLYRPDYTVTATDAGEIVASTTFTDAPLPGCYTDAGGVNDEPGQKDLTKMCANYDDLPDDIDVSWNWDDTGWTGNNSGDSCSLFDSDNDGFANYSICVTVKNTPAIYQNLTLYSCSDQKSDRCTNPTTQTASPTTTCTAGVQADDPFPTGDFSPNDTVAACSVDVDDVGGASTLSLLDGCSYPSQQPNSDPSDCVLASTANNTGLLEVVKNLVPTTDPGLFNLQIDTITYVVDVGNLGSTGEKVVASGNHTVGETAGTGTTLSNYSSAIVCRSNNGTGAIVAQSGTSGPLTVNVGNNADIVCTITNTRQQGTLTINKVVVPASASGLFNLQIDGVTAGTGANVGNGGTTGAVSVAPGTHVVGETAGTGTTLSDYTATYSGDCDAQGNVTVASGVASVCTITNTINPGSITVVKQTDPDGSSQSFDFTLTGSTTSATALTDGGSHTFNNLMPGTFALSEATVSGWVNTSTTCSDGSLPSSISVSPGETVTCTFTNTQNGHLLVTKVTDPATDTTTQFDITATGSGAITAPAARTITGGTVVDYEVAPGTYMVTEATEAGWMQTGNTCSDVIVAAGGQAACTITNTELSNVTVVKYEDANANGAMDSGETTLDGWKIWLSAMAQFTGAQVAGQVTFSDLNPGAYTLSEQLQAGWYQSNIACDNEIAIDNDNSHAVTLTAGQDITCYIGNYRNAHIIVTKDVVNPDGDPVTDTSTSFTFAVSGSTEAASLTDNQSHDYLVTPGLHTVAETTDPNYTFISCTGGIASNTFAGTVVGVASGETVNVTCTNAQKKATITVVKNVVASDGTTDVTDTNAFDVTVDGVTSPFAEGSSAIFSVNPGTYDATESAETNYTEQSNSGPVTVGSNGQATITIVNQQISPALFIAKSNDTGGSDKAPGDLVQFTLTITLPATSSAVNDVHVTDLPAGGFIYQGGSATAYKNSVPMGFTLHEYASPGVWDIGDMLPGDVIELVYNTTIVSDQQSGLYRDVAWAYGTSLASSEVIANADTVFVGTEVNVIQGESVETSVNVNREERREGTSNVLGASTSLPETGANVIWLAIAGLLTTIGVTSIGLAVFIDPTRRKRRHHA